MDGAPNLKSISQRHSRFCAVRFRVSPHANLPGIYRMAYTDYKFTPEDKMMLCMIKLIAENTPPEKRWLLTTSETKNDSLPIKKPITKLIKKELQTTTLTTFKMSPSTCGNQSANPEHPYTSQKLQSAITQVR